ncbi:MAG TPA: glycosyltransferase, partial [Acidimicrobiales bacterium]|nr:glycosyltransferase [Acidimicrobiales bacterium]
GARDFPELGHAVPGPGPRPGSEPEREGLFYRAVEFERRMPALLAAADVILCRAGASTVAEVATAGVPAVLVPLPNAPGDHQTANARALADAGAAVVLPDSECTPDRLEQIVGGLLGDREKRERMGAAGVAVARPGAADRVAALLEEHAR